MTFNFTLSNVGEVAAKHAFIIINTLENSGHALELLSASSDGALQTSNRSGRWKVADLQPGADPINFSITVRAKPYGVVQTAMRPATPIISFAEVRYCAVDDGPEVCTFSDVRYEEGTAPNLAQTNYQVILPALPNN